MPTTHTAKTKTAAFKRRQQVQIAGAAGRVEAATIVRPDRTLAGWFIVRFDDGHKLCVAASSIAALRGVRGMLKGVV